MACAFPYSTTAVILPDKEGRCADRFQGLLRTGSQGLPSRHTIGTSFPGTEHTTREKVKKNNHIKKIRQGGEQRIATTKGGGNQAKTSDDDLLE